MTHARIASALACLICLTLSGCVGVAPTLPGETDIRREIRERPFWTEAARVASLSGTDESAPAVHWLCDKQTTVTYNGRNFTTFQVTRVKTAILDSEKAEEYADIVIPTSDSRPVRQLYARTIRKDGSYVEVLPSDIHERSRFPGYTLYTDLREKVFAMPAFEDSCVIEYEYARTISGPDLEDHFIMSDRIDRKSVV